MRFTNQEKKIIETIYDVLQLTGYYASSHNFSYINRDNFFQIVSRICKKCNIIQKIQDGKVTMYSIKGVRFEKNVSQKGTGIDDSYIIKKLEQLYLLTKNQQPMMHDIHLTCMTLQLYDNLKKQSITPTKKNQYVIPISVNPRFSSKAVISSNNRLDLYVGCSQVPIPCTWDGFSELIEHIAETRYYLKEIGHCDFISPPARDWRFVYYHFNRDSEPINDPEYRFSLGDHSKYCYIKEFDNGQVKARDEEKRVSEKTIRDEQIEMLNRFKN